MSTQKKVSDSPESWEKLEEREADDDGSDKAPVSQKVDEGPKLFNILSTRFIVKSII